MTKKEINLIFDKIKKGVQEAIEEVYINAKKNGKELVVSEKIGVITKIKIK
jgi:hypothetical protein